MKNINIYALIPSKLNSKSIYQKNLKKINKKSLIDITIDEAKKSKFINHIFVSSESEKINRICTKKKVNFFKRDKKFSSVNASSFQVINEFIKKKKLKKNDSIIYLQPTSPFRKKNHIDSSIKMFIKNSFVSVIGVKKIDVDVFKCIKIQSKRTKSLFKEKYMTTNRQNFPDVYEPNGAIYIFKVKNFLLKKHVPTSNCLPFIMNEKDSTDIDSYDDLRKARKL